MAPFMLMTTEEADSSDGNPGIDKDGIEQKVDPGFKAGPDLPKTCYRENILPDTDDCPDFHGQDGIDDIRIEELNNLLLNMNIIPQMIIVTHNQKLENLADTLIKVEKDDGVSKVIL